MNIETIIRENYYECVIAAFAAVALVYACVHSLWRWVAGRRKATRLVADFEAAMPLKRGEGEAALKDAREYIAKHAPDLKYQGDQVTGIRKEVQELQSDFNRLHMSVQHLQADTQDLVDIRSRLFTLEGRDKPPTKWVTGGGSVVFSDDALAHKPAPAPEYRVFEDEYGIVYVCRNGVEVAVRFPSGTFTAPVCPWTADSFAAHKSFPELHGQCRDAIVAEFQVWRVGQ